MQFGVSEPLVLRKVEVDPQFLEVLALARLHLQQVLEEGLVALLDVLADDVAVGEHLQPKFRDLLVGEVVVLVLLLLLGQQLSDFLEVLIGEGMLSGDDIVDLGDLWREGFPELALDGLDLCLQLLVNSPLLNEITIDGNRLHLFLESRKRLDLLFNLLLDIHLRSAWKYLLVIAAVLGAIFRTLLRLLLVLLVFASHSTIQII